MNAKRIKKLVGKYVANTSVLSQRTAASGRARFWLVAAAAVAMAAGLPLFMQHVQHPFADSPEVSVNSAAAAHDARSVASILAAEDRRDQLAMQNSVAMINAIFIAAEQQGARRFADNISGMDAQANYVEDKMPWSDGKNLKDLVAHEFKKHVISPQLIHQQLAAAIAYYLQQRQANFNCALVQMATDIAATNPASPQVQSENAATLRALLQSHMAKVTNAAANENLKTLLIKQLGINIGASTLIGLAGSAAVSLGIGAGADGVGAAAAPETFGISLVAGVVAWYVGGKIYDAVEDPQGKIVAKVDKALEVYRRQLIDGAGGRPGFAGLLQESQQSWQHRRDAAIGVAFTSYEEKK